MYIFTSSFLIFGFGSVFASGGTLSCVNPFTLVGDQCLFFGGEWSMNHDNSKDICQTIGGWLARITTSDQHKAIFDHITISSELDHSYWVDGSDRLNPRYWIFSNGQFVPSGTPFWRTHKMEDENNTYIQRPNSSDNTMLNCLSLQKPYHYFFSDEDCDKELSPLCETDAIEGTQDSKSDPEHHISGNLASENLGNSKPSCGGDHVGLEGIITTPLYPLGALDNIECHHIITISQDLLTPHSYIALTFTNITGDCGPIDYVEVRDGLDITSPLLTKYSPEECCAPVNSTGSHMFLFIHIGDHQNSSCGARFDWKAVNTGCGSNITGVEGTLESPSYNGHYFNNLDCQWTISSTPELSTPDTHIILSINKFDAEIGLDYLVIRDGASIDAPVLANLSDHEVAEPSIHSSGQHLHFQFHTDESNTFGGFTIDWKAEICPSSYVIIGGMCLKFIWRDLSWGEASVSCQAEGGQLAAVRDPQQLRDIYRYLLKQGIAEDSFWLGGSDSSLENIWRWTDGSKVIQGTPFWGLSEIISEEDEESDNAASNSWNRIMGILKGYSSLSSTEEIQEPDGGNQENCLALLAEGFHFFRDVPCNWHLKALCSHPVN